jgi:hypothetical protein
MERKQMGKKKKRKRFEDLSLLEYVALELIIGLIDLGIFIIIIKSGLI